MPFGSRTILTSDLFHQYAPFLIELCDKFSNGETLIYSIQNGFGMSFIGNIITYMLSPFNLIIVLLGKENIQSSIAVVILLKTVLSAFTFSFALKRIQNIQSKILVPFTMLYALSSYFLAYYWNIMWLDGAALLPLVVAGAISLLRNGKFKLYVISLAMIIMSNFYIGYMSCIYVALYFFYYYIYQ